MRGSDCRHIQEVEVSFKGFAMHLDVLDRTFLMGAGAGACATNELPSDITGISARMTLKAGFMVSTSGL